MKSLLLASAAVLGLSAAPAFAQSANSNAGVSSVQGTYSTINANKGSALVGTVAGNYTDVNSTAMAGKGWNTAQTGANVTQVNVGGTISGGAANGKATGTTGGLQSSIGSGSASASVVAPPQHRH